MSVWLSSESLCTNTGLELGCLQQPHGTRTTIIQGRLISCVHPLFPEHLNRVSPTNRHRTLRQIVCKMASFWLCSGQEGYIIGSPQFHACILCYNCCLGGLEPVGSIRSGQASLPNIPHTEASHLDCLWSTDYSRWQHRRRMSMFEHETQHDAGLAFKEASSFDSAF